MPEEKQPNVLEKLQTFLSALTPKEQQDAWTILSAVRGPDNEEYSLKWYYTAAVRFELCPKMFGMENLKSHYDNHVSIPKRYAEENDADYSDRIIGKILRKVSSSRNNKHFSNHIAAAFLIIRRCLDGNSNQGADNAGGNQQES